MTIPFELALAGLIGGLFCGVSSLKLGYLSRMHKPSVFISYAIWWSLGLLCDICIALYMTYLLSHRNTNIRETQVIVNRLICTTIETGSCTAFVAAILLVTFFVWPRTNYFVTAVLCIAKLYSNSLLVSFNGRMHIIGSREGRLLSGPWSFSISRLHLSSNAAPATDPISPQVVTQRQLV